MGVLVKIAQGQALQAGEEIGAQVAYHVLRHPGHQVGLQPGAGRGQDVAQQHEAQQARQARQIAGADVGVERQAHQVRAQQVNDRGHDHQQGGANQQPALAFQVGPQAAQDAARILGFGRVLQQGHHAARASATRAQGDGRAVGGGCGAAWFSHCSALRCPTARRRSRGKWGWLPAAHGACLRRRSAHHPAPGSCRHSARC